MKFSIKDIFSKCNQIRSFLWIWSHLLKKSLMGNFIFCAVMIQSPLPFSLLFLLPSSVIFVLSGFHFSMLFLSIHFLLQPCSMPLKFLFQRKPPWNFSILCHLCFSLNIISHRLIAFHEILLRDTLFPVTSSSSKSPFSKYIHSLRSQQQVVLNNWLLSSSFCLNDLYNETIYFHFRCKLQI